MKCEDCKYYGELSVFARKPCTLPYGSNIVFGVGLDIQQNRYEKSNCCLMFYMTEGEKVIQETTPNDYCEMFTKKEKKSNG